MSIPSIGSPDFFIDPFSDIAKNGSPFLKSDRRIKATGCTKSLDDALHNRLFFIEMMVASPIKNPTCRQMILCPIKGQMTFEQASDIWQKKHVGVVFYKSRSGFLAMQIHHKEEVKFFADWRGTDAEVLIHVLNDCFAKIGTINKDFMINTLSDEECEQIYTKASDYNLSIRDIFAKTLAEMEGDKKKIVEKPAERSKPILRLESEKKQNLEDVWECSKISDFPPQEKVEAAEEESKLIFSQDSSSTSYKKVKTKATITYNVYIDEEYDPFKCYSIGDFSKKGPVSVGTRSPSLLRYEQLPTIKRDCPAPTFGFYPLKDRDLLYISKVIETNMTFRKDQVCEKEVGVRRVRQIIFTPLEKSNCSMAELLYLWMHLKRGVVCYRKKYGNEKEKLVIKIHEQWTKLLAESPIQRKGEHAKVSPFVLQYVVQDRHHPCFSSARGYSNIYENCALEFTAQKLYEKLFWSDIDTVDGNSFQSIHGIGKKKKFVEERNEETEKLASDSVVPPVCEGYGEVGERLNYLFDTEVTPKTIKLVHEREPITLCENVECPCIIL